MPNPTQILCSARRAALFALLALALCACNSTPSEPDASWRDVEVESQSERVLWNVLVLALQRQGYPLGAELDEPRLIATSGWRNHLAPFKGKGYRLRAQLRAESVGGTRYRVTGRVWKQLNQALVRPVDLAYAEWEWTEDDALAAEILLRHVESYFDPVLPAAPARGVKPFEAPSR
jgi:hypothetical protein